MKSVLLFIALLLPCVLFSAPKEHKVRMVFNIVDDYDRMENMQDTTIDQKTFSLLMEEEEGNKALEFVLDIGYEYIRSIIISLNNDLEKNEQTITVVTMDGKAISRKVEFFKKVTQGNKYVIEPSKLSPIAYDMDFYYYVALAR